MNISDSALVVLEQLKKGSVWDGDLISKQGRTDLINLGLAQRCRKDKQGLAINELTPIGVDFASRLQSAGRA